MSNTNPADVALTCDLDAEVEARIVDLFQKVMTSSKYDSLRHRIAREIVNTPFFIDSVRQALNPPSYTYTVPVTSDWNSVSWRIKDDTSNPR